MSSHALLHINTEHNLYDSVLPVFNNFLGPSVESSEWPYFQFKKIHKKKRNHPMWER
jgi:hypothetical protein